MLSRTTGSVFPSLGAPQIQGFPILIPSAAIITMFCGIVGAAVEERGLHAHQSHTLAAIRDTLLPKLLSGEIRVDEAEDSVSDVTSGATASDTTLPTPSPTVLAATDDDSPPSRPSIDDYDMDEVMAAFRQALRGRGAMAREDLLKDVSERLGFQRLGTRVRESLKGHLRAAIRRGIVASDGADDVRAATTTMADYSRDDLVGFIMSVTRKGTAYTYEEVIQAVASHVGFRRVTDGVREPIKSAINAAIRRGILGHQGDAVWREG